LHALSMQCVFHCFTETVPAFARYFEKRIVAAVRAHVRAPACICSEPVTWTNNNTESINHVLKMQVCLN